MVILLSANADAEGIARARALGVRDYLLKGEFSLQKMFARLRSHLSSDVHQAVPQPCAGRPAPKGGAAPTPPAPSRAATAAGTSRPRSA